MSYEAVNSNLGYEARITQFPSNFIRVVVDINNIELTPNQGVVTQAGTPHDTTNMNNSEFYLRDKQKVDDYLTPADIGILDASFSPVDFEANILLIINSVPLDDTSRLTFVTSSALDRYPNFKDSIDNELNSGFGAFTVEITVPFGQDTEAPSVITVYPNSSLGTSVKHIYKGNYDAQWNGFAQLDNEWDFLQNNENLGTGDTTVALNNGVNFNEFLVIGWNSSAIGHVADEKHFIKQNSGRRHDFSYVPTAGVSSRRTAQIINNKTQITYTNWAGTGTIFNSFTIYGRK